MRDMFFRGKRLDNKEWINESETYIHDGDGIWLADETTDVVKVDPTTVGQYTGLNDNNDKEIYEGDICVVEKDTPTVGKYFQTDDAYNSAKHKAICYFIDGSFRLRSKFLNRRNEIRYMEHSFKECEIIGNIHDNPELLKGSDDDE